MKQTISDPTPMSRGVIQGCCMDAFSISVSSIIFSCQSHVRLMTCRLMTLTLSTSIAKQSSYIIGDKNMTNNNHIFHLTQHNFLNLSPDNCFSHMMFSSYKCPPGMYSVTRAFSTLTTSVSLKYLTKFI